MPHEFAVMRYDYPEEPHRLPRSSDAEAVGPLTEAEQRKWCEQWVEDVSNDGFRDGVFYVARRTVTPWERLDSNPTPQQ